MNLVENDSQATIVKFVETNYAGLQRLHLSRYAIGYVVRGTKYIYYGDSRHTISRGEVFYMGVGNHYVEDIPEEGRNFEQIVIYYSPGQLQKILLNLNLNYSINISNSHSCERCRRHNHISVVASVSLRNLFSHLSNYLYDDNFIHDVAAENLKMTELIYTIVAMEEGCLRSKVLSNMDADYGSFEQIIYSHIFRDISIEELASISHRSLTSFKKEFKRHFVMPPHRWFIHQRLMQSRLLLISTSKSISEIGNECTFPNTSHFIKLFKKAYGTTPALYRNRHSNHLMSRRGKLTECSHERGFGEIRHSAV